MNDELWNQWRTDWHWITDAMHRHGCYSTPPVIAPPVSLDEITIIEKTCGITLPRDFVHVVTTYSASVFFEWKSRRREQTDSDSDWKNFPSPFSCDFWSWGKFLWSAPEYKNLYVSFDSTQEAFPLKPTPELASVWDGYMEEYNWQWHQKLPLLETPNGDFIAFDLRNGNDDGHPIVYLSHDLEDTHGMRLADNFIDFITTWSRVGCVGPEEWKLNKFHDKAADRLVTDGELGDRFRKFVNESQPWFPGTV